MNQVDEDLQTDGHSSMKDFGSFVFLLRYSRPFKGLISFSLVLILLVSVSRVVSAFYLGELVQKGLKDHVPGALVHFSVWIVVLELFGVLATWIGRYALGFAANGSILEIRKSLFAHLNFLPMGFYDKQPLGRIVTRLTYDVEGIEDFFSSTLARIIQATFTLVIVLISMLVADPKLGTIIVVGIIPAVIVTFALREPIRHWNREFARRNSVINARLSEYLNGLPVIRAFGAEDWSQKVFDAVVDDHLQAGVKINILNGWSRPLILLLCYMPMLMLIWFGGAKVIAGAMSLGLFITFIRLCDRFSRPIMDLAQELHVIQAAFTSAERVTLFLNHPGEESVLGVDGQARPNHLHGSVEFKDVTMAYEPGHNVLKNVSFHVKPGETIGLAGRTGSGKTSTVGLLARLYEYQGGEILLDGIPIRTLARDHLRSKLGYVSQDVVIFKGTLRENLDFSGLLNDADITEAMTKTGLDRVLRNRGLTLNDALLDQGANLSHGERQLIALTRILLRDPSLLVLDEATANIDPEYERIVHKAVDSVMKDRSCFIIAHRLDTLASCDRIFVFRDGKIVETGTHDELFKMGGYYYDLQMSSARINAEEVPADPLPIA